MKCRNDSMLLETWFQVKIRSSLQPIEWNVGLRTISNENVLFDYDWRIQWNQNEFLKSKWDEWNDKRYSLHH